MPKLRDVERVLQGNLINWLLTMEESNFNSHRVAIFRGTRNVQSEVYGSQAGEEDSIAVGQLDVLLAGDDFFPADAHSAGTFTEGYMYTRSDVPRPGDRVDLLREGLATRRYVIKEVEVIGTSQAVFKKFKLVAVGD